MQIVYFNPSINGITACAIELFNYLDNVLRLDVSRCVTDQLFSNGFEGVVSVAECIGGMCP